jgi:hypothetical protein
MNGSMDHAHPVVMSESWATTFEDGIKMPASLTH